MLPSILLRELRRIPSKEGAEAARYLAAHPQVPLLISFTDRELAASFARPYEPDADVLMAYRWAPRALTLAHRALHLDGRDEQSFIADQSAQGDLVHTAAASFVHETSHARQRALLGEPPVSLEDELLSAYRAAAFLLDALAADPGFDRLEEALDFQKKRARANCSHPGAGGVDASSAIITPPRLAALRSLAALAESNARFEAEVSAPYRAEGLPSLWLDGAARARKSRAKLERYEGLLRQSAGEGGAPPASSGETLRLMRAEIRFWESPDRLDAARSEYARALAALKADMDRRRRSGRMKVFQAKAKEIAAACR